jgi:hypothetical protein
MPQDPSMRASDSDREHVAEVLREAYAQGRLTTEEFHQRVDAAYGALTYGELSGLTRDLPGQDLRDLARRPLPAPRPGYPPARSVLGIWRTWLAVTLVTSTIWLVTAIAAMPHHAIPFWPIWPIGILGAVALYRTITGPRR